MSIKHICKASQLLMYRVQLGKVRVNETVLGSCLASPQYSINGEVNCTNVHTNADKCNQGRFINYRIFRRHQHCDEQRTSSEEDQQNARRNRGATLLLGSTCSLAFSFNFFKKSDDDENDPEKKLVNTIKRSIVCIQREQYDKAEQMLHLALRMAQDLQSTDGVTYVYDVMANLAMEREQFKKAEKIFTDVMKRLFADGYTEESPKILHISSKIAHMSQLQGELEKAHQGFTWTLTKLGKLLEKMPDDKDVQELLGLTKNWFGQLLMKEGNYKEATKFFKEAFDCLVSIYGAVNEASVTILNNISVAYVNLENYAEAKETLLQAMSIAKDLNDPLQEGVLQANLGLIYLHEGLLQQAQEACKLAWKMGKRHNNPDAIEQAEYCLSEIKSCMKE